MSDKRRPVLTYDPACRDCRRAAGKDAAGATWQCGPHVAVERDELRALLQDTVPKLIPVVRMPNIEYVADEHNEARDRLRGALDAMLRGRDESKPIPYDPNCLHCRRDAGKDSAGVTRLCEAHKADEIARLQRERDEARAEVARLRAERRGLP